MVSPKTVSYADRIKSGRPSSTAAAAKTPAISGLAMSNGPVYPASFTTSSEGLWNGSSGSAPAGEIPITTPNGLDLSATNHHHHHHRPLSTTPTDPSDLNTSNHLDLSLPSPPDSASAHTPKHNVWMVRKEQLDAARSAPHPSPPPPSFKAHNPPFASTPSASQATTPLLHPAPNHAGAIPLKHSKNKAPKPPSTAAQVLANTMPPSFAEKSNWPAPNEALASAVSLTTGTARKENHSPIEDEGERAGVPSHSRDSSTTGAVGHGKKQHWVRIPPSELAVDMVVVTHPSSPHARGRRTGDGDDRRNGSRPAHTVNRTSGQNSKRSSAAQSPAHLHLLPLTPSGSHQPLNANAPVFSSRGIPSLLHLPTGHPHSPLGKSSYQSSRSQSLVNSPHTGVGYHSPKPNPQYPLPPNPVRHLPDQLLLQATQRKKVRRLSPAKSGAFGGNIIQQSESPDKHTPVFGSFGESLDPEGGLGLAVDGADQSMGSTGVSSTPADLELGPDVIRWADADRKLSVHERILKTEGKFGIGIESTSSGVRELNSPESVIVVGDDTPVAAEIIPADNTLEDASSFKWTFGTLDSGATSPPDIMTVDPSRRPSYGIPYPEAVPSNGPNDYASYDTRGSNDSPYFSPRGFGDERSSLDQSQMGYPSDSMNGYGSRGGYMAPRRGGRGGSRGGYGSRGSYIPRGSGPSHPAYRNGAVPQQPYYGYQQSFDMTMPITYPPPMHTVDYINPIDPYSSSSVAPPPTPSSAHPSDQPYAPYPYGYPPAMNGMPYVPPVPYYPPYMGGHNGVMPPYYAMPYTPATPYPSMQPMPTPVTNVGYQLDPLRFALLGQVEYYLGPQNMYQDVFLRKHMDSQGWIPIHVIASFNRMRSLTMDLNLIRDTIALSVVIELSQNGESCRMINNAWEPYVLQGSDSQPSQATDAMPSSDESQGNIDRTATGVSHDDFQNVPSEPPNDVPVTMAPSA